MVLAPTHIPGSRALRRAAASLTFAALAACSVAHSAPEPAVELAAPSAATRWIPAEPAHDSAGLEAPARVLAGPDDVATVGVPLAARVLRVRVRPGQAVPEGAPLVDVVMPELIRAAGALRSAELRLGVLQKQAGRLTRLLEQELATAAELVPIEAEVATVRADREAARATLRAAGQADHAAAALLEGDGAITLRAAIAGTVIGVSAQLGQLREPAGGALVELAAVDVAPQIEARFSAVPPADARFEWVEPGRTLPLLLESVAPRATDAEGARLAWLRAAAGGPQPIPGAIGRVRMLAPSSWVVVPTRALDEREGRPHVAVKGAQGPARQRVSVIQRSASEVVVTGLVAGTLIAADASSLGRESAP